MGEIMPAGARTPQEWAEYITASWRDSVRSIVETGRRLLEARNAPENVGRWAEIVADTPIKYERAAQRLMALADHPDLGATDLSGLDRLPLAIDTLTALAQLPAGELPQLIEAGRITPKTQAKEATAIVREVKARDDKHKEPPADGPTPTTIHRADGSTLDVPAIKGKATFNRTNDQVSWADWTWNPVHGCLHGCNYCYAWELAELPSYRASYPEGFTPMFRPERLDAPANTALPRDGSEASRRVFVSSMGDLFGEWVPQDWIGAVMDACAKAPDWTYLFLTKFPQRYARLDLPPSVWLGTTVDTQARVRIAERAMRKVPDAAVRWLSCEPLLEPVTFADLSWCDWLVIGSQSAAHGQPEFAPPVGWVWNLIGQAREANVPVYCKPNLLGVVGPQSPGMALPREMPRQ